MVRTSKPRRGFTLVELLVVIGIIAVLIGILLPVLSRARESANQTSCMATLRQLGNVIAMYQGEFRGSYPYGRYMVNNASAPAKDADSGQDTPTNRATFVWWSVLRKYMKTGRSANFDNAVSVQSERFMGAFNCPTGLNRDAGCDFGCNPVIMPDRNAEGDLWNTPSVAAAGWSPNVAQSNRRHNIYRPATVKDVASDNVVIWDACEIPNNFDTQYCVNYGVDQGNMWDGVNKYSYRFRGNPNIASDPQVGDGTFVDPGPNRDGGGTFPEPANIRWRHLKNTSANFLMGDGSVRSFRISTVDAAGNVKGELRRLNLRSKCPNYASND